MINYNTDTATILAISDHLSICSNNFIPTLTNRVDIFKYAKKIRKFANTFEAWYKNDLIGLNAIYLNDTQTKIGFITNVSVDNRFNKLGIGVQLLKLSFEYAKNRGFERLILEVHPLNVNAIHFYLKNGFCELKNTPDYLIFYINL
jgi:ribosomal protein S18 acetylase RimI-like enzyme